MTGRPEMNFVNRIYARLMALWRYRGFVLGMVGREFRARYLGSLLGIFWAVLNPLAMIFVYTVIFSNVMGARLAGATNDTMAYGIFLCAGLLSWNFFAELLGRCQNIFIEQANLLKKLNFPRVTLPAILFLSTGINFIIIFGIFIGFLSLSGRFPGWNLLFFIPLLLIQQGFALGLGMLLGTLNVFFRDIGQAVGIILQFWFWFTPIIYPVSILPESIRELIYLNPMTQLTIGYQQIILKNTPPVWALLKFHFLGTILMLLIGLIVFTRLSDDIVDEL